MIVYITSKKKLKGKVFGLTRYNSPGKTTVEISEELNTTVEEFSATLLHELLHVWLAISVSNGLAVNKKNEHKFIYAVEERITSLFSFLRKNQNEKAK